MTLIFCESNSFECSHFILHRQIEAICAMSKVVWAKLQCFRYFHANKLMRRERKISHKIVTNLFNRPMYTIEMYIVQPILILLKNVRSPTRMVLILRGKLHLLRPGLVFFLFQHTCNEA